MGNGFKQGWIVKYLRYKQTKEPVEIVYDTETEVTKIMGKNICCYRYCLIIWMSHNLATFQFLLDGLTQFLCLNIKAF